MKKKRRGKREKKKGERSLEQIVKVFPDQMEAVTLWAGYWGLPVDEVLRWGTTEFNRRRNEAYQNNS